LRLAGQDTMLAVAPPIATHHVRDDAMIPARRIAMVAYTDFRTDPRCRREAGLAVDAGWEVDFYGLSRDGAPHVSLVDGVTLHEIGLSRYRGDDTLAYLAGYLTFLARSGLQMARDHGRRRFSVVHVNTMPDFMVATAWVPRLRGARVLLDVHDVMPEIYMSKFGLQANHWKIRLIRGVERLSAATAHHVLTAEHPKRDLLVEHGISPHKVSVLLNLPDHHLFPPHYQLADPGLASRASDDPGQPFRLIYHGTLAPRLGLDRAIGALHRLRERIPGATLDLIGDGDHRPELERMVRDLGLTDRITFSRGFRPIEEVIPTIRDAHLAVIPTRPDVSTDYMLPTKLLEYLACGIPALLTPTHTVRYYFGQHHPLYLRDGEPEELAKAIAWCRDHYDEAKRLTARMQESWFSRYHWPDHSRDYLRLLDNLAAPDQESFSTTSA
jgi:glycosyltransferase involved in cell wall biosynthesis